MGQGSRALGVEKKRLARIFGALLVTVLPTAAAEACGTSGGSTRTGTDATPEGQSQADGTITQADVGADAGQGVDATITTADANCQTEVILVDAGLDGDAYADPGCIYSLSCGVQGQLVTYGCQVYVQGLGGPDTSTPLGCYVSEESGCVEDAYAPDANLTFVCSECVAAGGGRRPAGLRRIAHRSERGSGSHARVARYLSRLAHDEAASVLAFERLARELAHHGAPALLQKEARRAARDEVRHARVIGRHATARGACPPRPRLAPRSVRRLSTIARENAVEGCVHETFAALLVRHQAERATDPSLRRAFEGLARDELRHAALSWAVARWIEPMLPRAARERVNAARKRAAIALEQSLAEKRAEAHDQALGLPSREAARELAQGMMRALEI